jgi:DNA-binding CsgD family transcriptional regulator
MKLQLQLKEVLQELQRIEEPEHKIEMATKSFMEVFPFARASIFSYTPLSYTGEGIIMVDSSGISSLSYIKEDVRKILPVYSMIQKPRAAFVPDESCKTWFPLKYVKEFELSSLVVVPIQHGTTIIGCIMADRYKGALSIQDDLLVSMRTFGKAIGQSFGGPAISNYNHGLSNREIEVLQRMVDGQIIKEMASEMGISEFTVRDYISSAMKKLGVLNRAQAIAKAIRTGII